MTATLQSNVEGVAASVAAAAAAAGGVVAALERVEYTTETFTPIHSSEILITCEVRLHFTISFAPSHLLTPPFQSGIPPSFFLSTPPVLIIT